MSYLFATGAEHGLRFRVEKHAGKTKTKAHGFHTASMSSLPTLRCNDRMQRNYSSRLAVGFLFCRTFALPPNIYMLSSGKEHICFFVCATLVTCFLNLIFPMLRVRIVLLCRRFFQKCVHTQSVQPSFNSIDACCSISLYV